MKGITKEAALKILFETVDIYDKNFSNKRYLFVILDKKKQLTSLETTFSQTNFCHLTGVKLNNAITASSFYNLCLARRLSTVDFSLAADGTTEQKLRIIKNVFASNLSPNIFGDFNNNGFKLKTEKLVGNVYAMLGFVKDQKSSLYVPNTLLAADIRDFVVEQKRVILVCRKDNTDKFYKEILKQATKNVNWSKIKSTPFYKELPLYENVNFSL